MKTGYRVITTFAMLAAFAGICMQGRGEIEWIDGTRLPLEGKAFADVENFYDRLPASAVATNTNIGVAALKHHTSGMQFRFSTTSPTVSFRWSPYYDSSTRSIPGMSWNASLGMVHMSPTGSSGIDVYLQGVDGKWAYAKTGYIYAGENGAASTGRLDRLTVKPGTPICVNLPLYNGLRSFELGVEKGSQVKPLAPHGGGSRPVVFYGTSITHGACASRPGLSFVNIIGRDLDVPVVNLGFAGHGRMEIAMARYLAQIDAGCYVLDCIWNMGLNLVKERYEPFIRELRRLRPDVPIVMAEWGSVFGWRDDRDKFMRELHKRLLAEGWRHLVYLPKDGMFAEGREGSVDGTHPNDTGMMTMAAAYGKAVREALASAAAPIAIGDRLEVFWDDAIVDRRATTAERRVHQPEYAGVAMEHDAPWEGDGSDFHNILEDVDAKGKLYRMYYLGWHFVDQVPPKNHHYSRDFTIRVCYAESRDGINWTKPNLGLHAYKGSKENNILLDAGQFGFGFDNFMVFKDANPACPPDERYKAVARIEGAFGGDNGKGGGLGTFLSADGFHFRPGTLITREGGFDSLNLAFWDATRGEYHCYFRGFHNVAKERNGDLGVRDVRHVVSKDFRTWTTPRLIDFRTPEGDVAEDYALYTSVIQPYPRAPHIFVGFPSRYVERKAWTPNYDRLPGVENRRFRSSKSRRHGLVVTDCVFIMTRDGARFHREDDAFMRPGPENPLNWVYGDCYPSRGLPIVAPRRPGADPELAFYTFEGHWHGGSESMLRWALRQDGFVSRHAPYAGAKVVTKPLVYDGDEMLLNFATSARGRLFVTLREVATGKQLKSCEIFGDKVDRPIDFVGGSPAQFRGRAVVMEFDMSDADVYSFRFRKK